MLFLVFQIGDERYALEASPIVAVLPLVHWKKLAQSPPEVAGVINYHGSPVPLVDLGKLVLGRSSPVRMSTRIILVHYVAEQDGASHLLGLLAEQATSTIRRLDTDFIDHGVSVDSTPYLGPVASDPAGMIQRVEVERLLTPSLRELLFRHSVEVNS